MKAPTLIDDTIRESLKPHNRYVPASFRPALIEARKFIMDQSMSEFLAELSHRPFEDHTKALTVIEQMRTTSRLPHKTTWVELDARAYKRYVTLNWPHSYDGTGGITALETTVPKIGWLLQQHEKLDTAFTASAFVGVVGQGREKETSVVFPMRLSWVCDDSQLPWKPIAFSAGSNHPSELLTGVGGYKSDKVGYTAHPGEDKRWSDVTRASVFEVVREFVGELRHIFAFLSTINDLPVQLNEVRPSKGYFARGKYRRFVEHTTITLKVPAKSSLRTLAQKAVMAVRRRAHQVRGHWRVYLRGDPLCVHAWSTGEDGHVHCPHCQSFKTWIAEHQRGDAMLGIVTHDYMVQHDQADSGPNPGGTPKTDPTRIEIDRNSIGIPDQENGNGDKPSGS